MLVDINLIIATIIGVVAFGISYVAFDKILDNADAWIKKRVNENVYGKVNFAVVPIFFLIVIIYGVALIFKYI